MSSIIIIVYLFFTIWSLVSIILHGSRPNKSISWVLAVLALPFAGPLLYYLFGVNRRKFRLFKLRQTEKRKLYSDRFHELSHQEKSFKNFENDKPAKLASLTKNNSYTSAYKGNQVTLLDNGESTFKSIFEAIRRAKHFIHIQYYIIEKGDVLDQLFELCQRKVDEGVEVRIIYDSLGSYSFRGASVQRFRDLGVIAHSTMPLRFGNLLFSLNYRNHRKIVIIDGHTGFTGGVNISDEYIKEDGELGIWKDFHIKIKGPVVNSLHRIFIKDYHFSGEEDILLQEKYLPKIEEKGNTAVQIVASGPDSEQPAIMQQYIAMINLAESSIYIANPYFIPGIPVLEALKIAAMKGVAVNILVPKKSDSILARLSMFANFETLLSVGVQIYLRPDFSHSKVIVIDNEIASVGSGNFDYRSFEHNFETNAIIYDGHLAKNIVNSMKAHCKKDICIDFNKFKNRSTFQKFAEGFAKFFSPLL